MPVHHQARKFFYFLGLLVFVFSFISCTTISFKKYGFEGEYIEAFGGDRARYIRPAEDAPRATFILKERKNQAPVLLFRLSLRSYGYWFNIARVQVCLPKEGKSFLLTGSKQTWGRPKEPVYSTTILSQRLLVQKFPMTQLINEHPVYNGQIYTWTEVLGQDYLGRYRYRVYVGRYNIDYVSDYTYESLYVDKLSDEELELISQADTLSLVFISEDENRETEKSLHLDNRSFVKQAVYKYYKEEKERYLEEKTGKK